MSSPTRLALDAGQSGIRIRITAEGRGDVVLDAPGVLTDRPVLEQVAERMLEAAREYGAEVHEAAAGVSGLTPAATRPDELLAAVASAGVRRVAVAHDSISGYLAANDTDPGVMLAVGTGVVVLAVSEAGVAKVDGWGNLVGDAGSGYWIGRTALEAVMRAFDGRGDATALERRAVEAFGPLDELYMVLQGDPRRVARIASFCRTTVETAEAGDAVAARVVDAAAAELAHSAHSALVRAGWAEGTTTRVSAVGSLPTKSAFFRGLLAAALEARGLGADVREPRHPEPIEGVAALLDVAPRHPLFDRIAHAEA